MQDVITVSCAALPDGTRVIGFRGTEALSTPYEIAIDLLLPMRDDDADDGLPAILGRTQGERLSLAFDRHDGRPPLRWHGVVGAVEIVHDTATASIWTVVLVPRLWNLKLTRHNRIFVDETTPKIIAAVLEQSGLEPADYELRLAADYKPREHVFQYRESDFAFLSRWMEREGLYYFFEQGDDRERLVITDSAAYHGDFSGDPVRYVPLAGADSNRSRVEALDTWKVRSTRTASKVKLTDYDYNRPDLDVSGAADVEPRGFGEVRLFGENFATQDEAKRLAAVRAQQLLAEHRGFIATGNVWQLRPGYTFQLEDHPRTTFNSKHLVTSVDHVANQSAHALKVDDLLGYGGDDLYRSTITAIPAQMQFRARRSTPAPRADGILTAFVDGPADSKYAQIDKQGRYKVRVKFDEGDLADGKASTFVRMLQPHGGSTEGFHFPLRKGTEVSLLFLGGDPDRPVIAGVVPNAKTPSPVTGDNHTKNVIHTGGGNRLEIEDAEGREYVKWTTPYRKTTLHIGAPHNPTAAVYVGTEGNAAFIIGEDWVVKVDKTLQQDIKGYTRQGYHDTREETTEGYFHQEIKAGFLQVVTGGYEQHVVNDFHQHIDAFYEQKVGGDFHQEITGFHEQHMKAGLLQTVDGFYEQNANAGMTQNVSNGCLVQNIHGELQQKIDTALRQNVGTDAFIEIAGHLNQKVHGDQSWLTLGQKTSVTFANVTDVSIASKETFDTSAEIVFKQGLSIGINATLDFVKKPVFVKDVESEIASGAVNLLNYALTSIG